MLAVMQDRSQAEVPKEFLETGRTGRRNAMPDILHPAGAETSTADLPDRLQQLATTDADPQAGPSTSREEDKRVESSTPNKEGGS